MQRQVMLPLEVVMQRVSRRGQEPVMAVQQMYRWTLLPAIEEQRVSRRGQEPVMAVQQMYQWTLLPAIEEQRTSRWIQLPVVCQPDGLLIRRSRRPAYRFPSRAWWSCRYTPTGRPPGCHIARGRRL